MLYTPQYRLVLCGNLWESNLHNPWCYVVVVVGGGQGMFPIPSPPSQEILSSFQQNVLFPPKKNISGDWSIMVVCVERPAYTVTTTIGSTLVKSSSRNCIIFLQLFRMVGCWAPERVWIYLAKMWTFLLSQRRTRYRVGWSEVHMYAYVRVCSMYIIMWMYVYVHVRTCMYHVHVWICDKTAHPLLMRIIIMCMLRVACSWETLYPIAAVWLEVWCGAWCGHCICFLHPQSVRCTRHPQGTGGEGCTHQDRFQGK